MKIKIFISIDNLGDENAIDINKRYVAAVQARVQDEYPTANVSANLVTDVLSTTIEVYDYDGCDVKLREQIHDLMNQVWEADNY